MHNPSALDQLARDFASWRNDPRDAKATPAALRQQAVRLRSAYRVSQIIEALGINYRALKRWSDEYHTPTTAPAFVALPTDSTADPITPSVDDGAGSVLCELPNGVRLTLATHTLSPTLLSTLCQLNFEAQS
jgi:hypothetical protein